MWRACWWTGCAARCYPELSHASGCNRLWHCRKPVRLDHRLGARQPAGGAVGAGRGPGGAVGPGAARPTPNPQPAPIDPARVTALQDAAAKNPKDVQPRVQLGNMFFDGEQYPQAITWYEQALALDPRDANVSTDLGVAYYYTNQSDRALDAVRSLAVDRSQTRQDAAEHRHRARVRQAGSRGRRQGVAAGRRSGARLTRRPGGQEGPRGHQERAGRRCEVGRGGALYPPVRPVRRHRENVLAIRGRGRARRVGRGSTGRTTGRARRRR